jgi:hypothetical protein
MWLRADDKDRFDVFFDNMSSRPIRGSTGWTRYNIDTMIPPEAVWLNFGILLDAVPCGRIIFNYWKRLAAHGRMLWCIEVSNLRMPSRDHDARSEMAAFKNRHSPDHASKGRMGRHAPLVSSATAPEISFG